MKLLDRLLGFVATLPLMLVLREANECTDVPIGKKRRALWYSSNICLYWYTQMEEKMNAKIVSGGVIFRRM